MISIEAISDRVLRLQGVGPAAPEPGPPARGIRADAAEAVVAARLSRGDTLKAVPSDHAVSLSTRRTQLAGVFAKTDTHRQSDPVRLLLGLRGELR